MTRPNFRRSLRFENLETRQLMSAGGPTAQEQYMLELINQARTNPQAAADRVSSNLAPDVSATLSYYKVDLNATKQAIATSAPKPPLAWNDALAEAAQAHSQDMASTKVQSHSGSDGSTPDSRMNKTGYTNTKATGENAYAYATSVDEAMQAFLLDWGVSDQGHRRNLQQGNVTSDNAFQDVGIGIVNTSNSKFGPLVITQDFGSRNNSLAQLLGVAYSDDQKTRFYEPGEGRANVRIDAMNLDTGVSYTTTTQDAGGYQMPLPAGRYQVVGSLNDQVIQAVTITIGKQNVKQDFVLSTPWDGRNRQQVIASVSPNNKTPSPAMSTPAATPTVAISPQAMSSTSNSAQTFSLKSASVATPAVSNSAAVPVVSSVAPKPMGAWTSWKANRA
jgi:uncharacterized protein YkwD